MGARDGEEDELEALLRAISANHARLEESDVRRAAQRFFGRPDTLELLREVAREEQLLRRLRVEITSGSEQGSGPRRCEPPGVLPNSSLINGAYNSRARPSWWRVGLAAAAALTIGIGLNWSAASRLLRTIGADGGAEYRTAETRTAELDTVNLPDGSRAILAPNSTLRYAIAPLTGHRELQLDGEAYFDVKHNDERLFRVQTHHAVVEDLGTIFIVSEYAADGRARVAVRSGAAALRALNGAATPPMRMREGDGAYVDSSGAIVRFRGDPESYGSWTTGRLAFDAAPLSEVLSRLASWYDVEFQLTDSTLSRQYFTGAFDAVSLPQALEILGPIVHARFEQQGRVVVVAPRSGSR